MIMQLQSKTDKWRFDKERGMGDAGSLKNYLLAIPIVIKPDSLRPFNKALPKEHS